jgi:hypothetical protein
MSLGADSDKGSNVVPLCQQYKFKDPPAVFRHGGSVSASLQRTYTHTANFRVKEPPLRP